MINSTQGIVLQTIKYADKKIILKVYTRDFGMMTLHAYISKSKISNSIIQPLSQIEFEFLYKENRDVQTLKEVKINYQYQTIHIDFYKLCIAQFINEVLLKCLKEQSKNEELFNFIISIYRWLDQVEEGFSSIHVYLLFELTRFLGFYPLNNYDHQHSYFNLMEGCFQSQKLDFPIGLNTENSKLFSKLFDADINFNLSITKVDRDMLLEIFILYYKYHLPDFNHLKSLQVLKDTLKE